MSQSLVDDIPFSAHDSFLIITETEVKSSRSSLPKSMSASSQIIGFDEEKMLTRALYTACIAAALEMGPMLVESCEDDLEKGGAVPTRIDLTTLNMHNEKNMASQFLASRKARSIVRFSNACKNCDIQL
jgi:hypothetical protein